MPKARVLLYLLVVACSGCGGAQSAAPAPKSPAAVSSAPEPSVPGDPRALVPADASFLASAQLAPFFEASSFPTFRGWAERYACIPSGEIDWLMQHTTRAVLAGRGLRNGQELLLVLDGKYAPTDVARVLDFAEARGKGARGARAQRKVGRFLVTSAGPLESTLLDERLLLVGNAAMVTAALDRLVPAPAPAALQGATFQALAAQVGCADKSLCVVVAPEGLAAARVDRELSGLGMKRLGNSLADASSAFAIDPRAGLTLAVATQMRSGDDAARAVKDVNDRLWQLGVFARLAGFPDVFDHAHVRNDDSLALFTWQLTERHVARIQGRIGELLADSAPACAPQPLAAGSVL